MLFDGTTVHKSSTSLVFCKSQMFSGHMYWDFFFILHDIESGIFSQAAEWILENGRLIFMDDIH